MERRARRLHQGEDIKLDSGKETAGSPEKHILVTYRKAFRNYTVCWKDHISVKLKGAGVIVFKYREAIKSLKAQC